MKNRLRTILPRFASDEAGNALILVTIFLVLGSLTIVPVLGHIGTALETGRAYEYKTEELYAADSGVEDAIWQIKYGGLEALFDNENYAYNFSANSSYVLEDPINDMTTNVTISTIWIPSNVSPPTNPALSREILESNKLMVSGTAGADPEDPTYKIKIFFYPGEDEEDKLLVESLGVWLPLGFSYDNDSSNLEQLDYGDPCRSIPTVEDHAGGEAIVWEFASANLTFFPGVEVDDEPQYTEITFTYTATETGAKPTAISWIETTGAVIDILPVTWDIDTQIYRVISVSGNTEIEAYSSRCELRDMNEAFSGDYEAVGNSLMQDLVHDYGGVKRDNLLDDSDATINDIPDNGEALRAFLYWSGWFEEQWMDHCNNFNNWDKGDDWSRLGNYYNYYFGGDHDGSEEDRLLTMDCDPVNLSVYDCDIMLRWQQWENGDLDTDDALLFQVSGDGGENWSGYYTAFEGNIGSSAQDFLWDIPSQYLTSEEFLSQFYLKGFSDHSERCYLDEIAIMALEPDTAVNFEIDNIPRGQITADTSQTLVNYPGYSYACKADVTDLVRTYTDGMTGNAIYTVGDVEGDLDNLLSYAGWSIVVIYFSPESAGHHLYLFDDFAYCHGEGENLDFDFDEQPGGDIDGFIIPEPIEGETVAATLTCFVGEGDEGWTGDYLMFNDAKLWDGIDCDSNSEGYPNNVWNGYSEDMQYDGVDIDTFEIEWDDEDPYGNKLLEPGDTEAHMDMVSPQDHWNLVYMILSLRSKTYVGGTEHYVISYG
jgi:Flp pilus assembly pilin Flp